MMISSTLQRIDQEITQHRQAIAVHQVEIGRLEEARRVLIAIEEKDAGLAESHLERINGHAGERPMIIARRAAPSGQGAYRSTMPLVEEALQNAGKKGIKAHDLPGEIRQHVHHSLDFLRKRGVVRYAADHRRWYWIGEKEEVRWGQRTGINARMLDYIRKAGRPVPREELIEAFSKEYPPRTIGNALYYLRCFTGRIRENDAGLVPSKAEET